MYMLRKAAVEFARGISRREMFIPRRFRQQRSEEIHTKQAAFSLKRVKMWGIRMVKVDSSGIAGKLVNTRMRRDHCVLASPAFTLGLSYLLRGQEVFLFCISTVRLYPTSNFASSHYSSQTLSCKTRLY